MSVLVRRQQIEVHRPEAEPDEHGWITADEVVLVATYEGSIQTDSALAGAYDPLATDRGGAGPFDPRVSTRATAYLDPEADVQPGDILYSGGLRWLVGDVRLVLDPRGSGDLDCLVCGVQTLFTDTGAA